MGSRGLEQTFLAIDTSSMMNTVHRAFRFCSQLTAISARHLSSRHPKLLRQGTM